MAADISLAILVVNNCPERILHAIVFRENRGGKYPMHFADIVFRTYLALGVLLILARIMGRKSVAQLTLYDYVLGLILGNIGASFAIDRDIDVKDGIVSLIACTIWILAMDFITMHSISARKYINSEPIMVIFEGRILEENLRKKYYTVNSLLELLREQEVFDPSAVKVGIIESNGQLSILKKEKAELTKEQTWILGAKEYSETGSRLIGRELIIDGKIIEGVLQEGGVDEQWLMGKLQQRNIKVEEVTIAIITPEGKLYIDTTEDGITGKDGKR
jgi:uncharacterized membrane protein YcaP (DUF421 family)